MMNRLRLVFNCTEIGAVLIDEENARPLREEVSTTIIFRNEEQTIRDIDRFIGEKPSSLS